MLDIHLPTVTNSTRYSDARVLPRSLGFHLSWANWWSGSHSLLRLERTWPSWGVTRTSSLSPTKQVSVSKSICNTDIPSVFWVTLLSIFNQLEKLNYHLMDTVVSESCVSLIIFIYLAKYILNIYVQLN